MIGIYFEWIHIGIKYLKKNTFPLAKELEQRSIHRPRDSRLIFD